MDHEAANGGHGASDCAALSKVGTIEDRFAIQDSQYAFPYHYLAHFGNCGTPRRTRALSWGFEYLCYQLHVAARVRELSPRSLLEVGCGDGRFVGMLREIERRIGIDLSESAIRFARSFHPNVEFLCVDSAELDESFDVVAAVEVLEHIPDEEVSGFLRALADRVAPGGHVVLSVPSSVVPLHRKHYRHYDEALLRREIERSGIPMHIARIEHVYAPPAWLDFWLRYTCNDFLVLELRPLNRWLWSCVWRRARFGRPGTGRHLVATLVRTQS